MNDAEQWITGDERDTPHGSSHGSVTLHSLRRPTINARDA
jgi:hypothetical protein